MSRSEDVERWSGKLDKIRVGVERMEKTIQLDEHLMGSLLEAYDHSEGDTVAQIIDVKIRRRMDRV